METVTLYAPPDYWTFPARALNEIANGCGAGKLGDLLVPDTVYGLSIRPACRVHDFMYHFGADLEDKEEADRVFMNNMIRIVNAAGGFRWLRWLRLRRCRKYYFAVACLGGPAFWRGKNSQASEKEVEVSA